jgi:hypothetical protein
MKLRFICLHHRRWLANDPPAALSMWLRCYECGLRLEQQRRDLPAIQQAGFAMELAEVLMRQRLVSFREDIVRFTHSALLVVRLLRRQGAHGRAEDAIHHAIDCLRQMRTNGAESLSVHRACARLTDQLPCLRSDESRGYGS